MRKGIINKIFKKYKEGTILQKLSYWILVMHMIVVLFANLIANDKPIFCICNSHWYVPAFSEHEANSIDFLSDNCTFRIMPLISWSAGSIDAKSSGYSAPLRRTGDHIHLLGTDALGRDVLAGLIYGTRYAWTVGLLSTLLAYCRCIYRDDDRVLEK
jgi:ABC-type microcin C transport system permease subunit YejE